MCVDVLEGLVHIYHRKCSIFVNMIRYNQLDFLTKKAVLTLDFRGCIEDKHHAGEALKVMQSKCVRFDCVQSLCSCGW